MSAKTTESDQTTLTDETAEEHTRRRTHEVDGVGGPGHTARFLQCVPPDTDFDDLGELWEAYKDEVGGIDE